MSTPAINNRDVAYPRSDHPEATASGVSWSAVIAGALSAAALSLILLSLGAGLGLSSVSPWANEGASETAIKSSAVVWLVVMEVLSSLLGGYLAGRLRTKWTVVHSDEVYFRDTAHGFLAWCASVILTAGLLTSAASVMAGAPSHDGAAKAQASPHAYFIDSLFRGDGTAAQTISPEVLGEADAIFAKALHEGSLSANDQAYLSHVISARTGINQADASSRVNATFEQSQQAADVARKALAHSLLWTFLALLIGAFCASFAATIGGKQRDHVAVI